MGHHLHLQVNVPSLLVLHVCLATLSLRECLQPDDGTAALHAAARCTLLAVSLWAHLDSTQVKPMVCTTNVVTSENQGLPELMMFTSI